MGLLGDKSPPLRTGRARRRWEKLLKGVAVVVVLAGDVRHDCKKKKKQRMLKGEKCKVEMAVPSLCPRRERDRETCKLIRVSLRTQLLLLLLSTGGETDQ